ncbi:hypothetical protein [Pseudooceanicola nitratireducens]
MSKPMNELVEIYKRNLARYEAEGDVEKAEVEKRLIARLEREAR